MNKSKSLFVYILFLLGYVSIAQATFPQRTEEFMVDTVFLLSTSNSNQDFPSVASDGEYYLAVWCDKRLGFDIYGTRVDNSGSIMDTGGIQISIAEDVQDSPAVAFGDSLYFVVWVDCRDGVEKIFGARVDCAGIVLDPDGIRISSVKGWGPAVSFDGANFVVVWQHRHSFEGDIYCTRVTPSGIVLDPNGILICNASEEQKAPSVASNRGHTPTAKSLIVWEDHRNLYLDIYGARITGSGVVLDTNGFAISEGGPCQDYTPSVSFDGSNYLVVWRAAGGTVVRGVRVDQQGNILPWERDIGIGKAPALTFDGTNYLVVFEAPYWDDYIHGTRVDTSGAVLDSAGIPISNGGRNPAVTFNGTDHLAVWRYPGDEFTPYPTDIHGSRVDTSGTVIDSSAIILSVSANAQEAPAVTCADNNYFVVWSDWRDTSSTIYGGFVDTSGGILQPMVFRIAEAETCNTNSDVAFGGENYLVVWRSFPSSIVGTRVDRNGNILNPVPIVIQGWGGGTAEYYNNPAVAFGAARYCVVYEFHHNHGQPIKGAMLNLSGGITSYFLPHDGSCSDPTVVSNGDVFFIACSKGGGNIYGTRVDYLGSILDPDGIAICTLSTTEIRPSVCTNGSDFFAVWQDFRNGSDWNIYGSRIDASGTVLDPDGIAICTDAGNQEYPDVIYTGSYYIVVWQDDRNDQDYDIYGAILSTTGTVLDTIIVSTQLDTQRYPALTCLPGGHVLITYEGWADSVGTHPGSVMRIWGKCYPYVGIEERPRSKPMEEHERPGATIFRGPLHLPEGKRCQVFDITGRVVEPEKIAPGIYFVEIDNEVVQKVVKIR